jgi:hypothetical protein
MTAVTKLETEKSKRHHRATFATDKRKGGYLIRVAGPYSDRFVGREIPVTLKSGEERNEKLTKLVWSGKDKESGELVTLYQFEAKPVQEEQLDF